MPTSTVEQYIKTIYQQEEQAPGEIVPMKDLSSAMEVTPGTATTMVKHLAGLSLVSYVPRKGVVLTPEGRKLALTMVRRHRLIETFLEQVLGYDWAEVHDDAEDLEHAVSDRFVERIDSYLGYPATDPHGAPIPSREGRVQNSRAIPLDQCEEGSRFRISRVGDTQEDFLSFLKAHRLTPGEEFILETRSLQAGTITVRHAGSRETLTLGADQGARIAVAPQ
ncbi:Mn-dependent transcriptional regulator [Alkalispirochaeta sphaeroplastigenens]|uniref:Transcriptional regulator MntR n=1 Tax=Alkalispirochaeta sphaeroplastigenens TaxID=1187066 RepID=A0A2S4K152_9SPIO|nr:MULTISPECIES: metal-dependent transcriptional regulator [Alkalispirochaeta]POR05491.1 Mn-dependent transcriptional regulator [Alkalispirochaeta sphaeroplastigenens]